VQDAFLKAFANLHRLERPGLFRSWLLQITANRARDYLRMESRRSRFLKEAGAELAARGGQGSIGSREAPADTPMERKELKERITTQVQALPEPYRQVASLRYLDDRSYPEIAEDLGVPEKVVKQRMWRARSILRMKLKKWRPMSQA
jgi:RNA polymerase sigma-70 factor (ECF subfamily)